MRVRHFAGPDLATAIGAVRRELGADALIIETRYLDNGVEILASIESGSGDVAPLDIPLVADAYLDERRDNLRWHGVSEELTARLTEQDLAQAIARRVGFGALAPKSGERPLFFAGEPGAGKSLSLIKLATRLVMAGTTPMVISTDGCKAGATEQLAAMTRLLGLTLVVADQAPTLKRALGMRVAGAPVLIDGTGSIARASCDDALLRSLVEAADADIVLVVPAGLDAAETVDVAAYHAALGARCMIATRLDVARRVGGILEAAWRSRLTLTEAGVGPSAVDGLESISPRMLAERLGTRIARTVPVTQKAHHRMERGVEHGAA